MNFQPKLKEVEMKNMVKNICAAMVISLCAAGHLSATENNPNNDNKFMEENLNLTQEWDKTFPQSDKVDHKKITFHNRYGITLAADLYVPTLNTCISTPIFSSRSLKNIGVAANPRHSSIPCGFSITLSAMLDR